MIQSSGIWLFFIEYSNKYSIQISKVQSIQISWNITDTNHKVILQEKIN